MPLDCVSEHRVYVYDRGGMTRIGELVNLNRVKWGRVRDDISQAEVDITAANCAIQQELLGQIEPGRHEFVVFRGNDRVWEGPITRATYSASGVEFFASDVMYYVYRTVMHFGYDNAYPNVDYVTNRCERILRTELARKEALSPPINVLPYLVNHHVDSDTQTSRVTAPYAMTAFEHIDDLAAKAGMDYTVVGRAIHLWDTSKALGYTAQATENDFLGDLYVTVYGSELGTASVVVASDGTYGTYGGIDPYYGEWERLATAYDEGADANGQGGTPPSVIELTSQARRNLSGRNPTPLQVRIPDNSTVNPKGVLSVTDLIPGVYVPLVTTTTARAVSQMQKIGVVSFEESPDGETIGVTLFPASASDDDDTAVSTGVL